MSGFVGWKLLMEFNKACIFYRRKNLLKFADVELVFSETLSFVKIPVFTKEK